MTATLTSIADEDIKPFETWLASSSDVETAFLMSEGPAMVLTLRIRHIDDLDTWLAALRRNNPVVTAATARVASRMIKQTLYLPIDDVGGRI